MKKTITILLTLCLSAFSFGQNVNIPDANFKAYLVGNPAINTNKDTEISVAEAEAFTGKIEMYGIPINDMTGIETFVNLDSLNCGKSQLTSLDLTQNTKLSYLYCTFNQLTEICIATTHNTDTWEKDANAFWSTDCKPLAFEELESVEKAIILKAYNLQGQEVPTSTKGEVIILLYDNGVREKTYVGE